MIKKNGEYYAFVFIQARVFSHLSAQGVSRTMLTQWKIIVPVTEPSFWKLSTQSSSSYTQHRVIIAQTQELSGKKEGSPALHKQSLQQSVFSVQQVKILRIFCRT